MVHVRIKLLLTTGNGKKIIWGEKPTAASLGSAIKKDNGWIVFPALGNLAVPNLEATLSFSISFLETQFIGSSARSLGTEEGTTGWQ